MSALLVFPKVFPSGPCWGSLGRGSSWRRGVWGDGGAAGPQLGLGAGSRHAGWRAPEAAREHPKEPAGKRQEGEGTRPAGGVLRREQNGGSVVQGWAKAKLREHFGEGKRGFALTAAFSAPLSRAGTSPQTQEGCFPGRGSGDRERLVPAPTSPPTRTPSSRPMPQGKNRASAPWAEENRAGSLASSGFHLPAPSPLGSRT